MNLLGHQPVLVIDHREHMLVLILVFQFQGSIGLELFLDPLNQFFEWCVCLDEDCTCVDVVAFHTELFRKKEERTKLVTVVTRKDKERLSFGRARLKKKKESYLVAETGIDGFVEVSTFSAVREPQMMIAMIRLLLKVSTNGSTTASRGRTPNAVAPPESRSSILAIGAHTTKIRKDRRSSGPAWRAGTGIVRVVGRLVREDRRGHGRGRE